MLVAVTALIALLAYGISSRSDDRTLDDKIASGQRPAAPDRGLPLLSGGATRSLASYRGKVVVLNFWASWCTPCKVETPALQKVHESLQRTGRGLVLGVDFKDTTKAAGDFVREYRLTYPVVRDFEGRLAKLYGTRALPETFVIDASGRIAAVHRGLVDAAWVQRAVRQAERS